MTTVIEVAVVRPRTGVNAKQLETAALSINAQLKEQSGFVQRTLGVSEEGVWTDLIHWRSREEADAALNEAMHIPAFTDYFEKVESQLSECAILFEQICVQSSHEKAVSGAIEIVIFRGRAGVMPERLRDAAVAINPVLPEQDGFVSREFGMRADGLCVDLVHWRDRQAGQKAAREIAHVRACADYFSLIDAQQMQLMYFDRMIY